MPPFPPSPRANSAPQRGTGAADLPLSVAPTPSLSTNAAREEDARSGHTPGPWWVRLYPGTYSYEVRASGAAIASVGNLGSTSDHRPTAKRWQAETPANARLIAAAPDLLEAAQLLEAAEDFNANDCPDCEGDGVPELCGTCFPLFDDARVARRLAIAKATGAEPAQQPVTEPKLNTETGDA
jgi:hypothetical protein